ncbi:MAG: GtrA family protein [Candidatus Nealsonbacteria bacterium]|nr:GtrA family protein [Candidatus Nealsonbacteria bacterium]
MKKDLLISLLIGEISSWLILLISQNLFQGLKFWWLLPIIFPLLCAGGMFVALFFKKKLFILYQFAKFFLVGGLNVLVDLGVLNLLILISAVSAGLGYSAFKGVSFLVATTNSYFWNKSWTFGSRQDKFGQFLVVSAIGFLVNVGTASLVVNLIGPQFGLNLKTWANLGALVGSVVGLAWNFLGYKFVVFK